MARARSERNGRLEEAMRDLVQSQAALTQAQATLAQNQAQFLARMAETDRINSERFARIEAILLEHSRILAEHSRILRALPDTIREKIGFKTPDQAKPAQERES
jgi:hypothetical protein